MPVSYTHLDVYKRQVVVIVELNLEIFIYMNILLIDGFPIKFPGVPLFDLDFLRDKLRIRNITGHGVVLEHGVEPVSYTHLDVYKRQVEGVIDFVVFFSDPLTAQPHDPDVKALMRIAQVYDIPMAINKATADFMITSMFMEEEYEHDVINFRKSIKERAENM